MCKTSLFCPFLACSVSLFEHSARVFSCCCCCCCPSGQELHSPESSSALVALPLAALLLCTLPCALPPPLPCVDLVPPPPLARVACAVPPPFPRLASALLPPFPRVTLALPPPFPHVEFCWGDFVMAAWRQSTNEWPLCVWWVSWGLEGFVAHLCSHRCKNEAQALICFNFFALKTLFTHI